MLQYFSILSLSFSAVNLNVFLWLTYRILIERVVMTVKTPPLTPFAHLHTQYHPWCLPHRESHPQVLLIGLEIVEKQVQNHISLLLSQVSTSFHKC